LIFLDSARPTSGDQPFNASTADKLVSMTAAGWLWEGSGGKANVSEVLELGGLNADNGNFGSVFGPLRRAPTLRAGPFVSAMVVVETIDDGVEVDGHLISLTESVLRPREALVVINHHL